MENTQKSGNNHLNHDTANLKPVTAFVKGTTFYDKPDNKPEKSNKR